MTANATKVNQLVNALNTKFENKQANKKNDISGDYSTDNVSYPTVKAVKDYVDSATPDLSSKTVTLEKQATADTGYFATYVLKQGGTALSPKINIPKDYLVKSGEVKTCTTANVPVSGYNVGDKYLDFVVNTKDSTGTDEHIYILVSDLVDVYSADGSTLQLSSGNVFSIKEVPKAKLASGVQTSLGYADNWNSSVAKGITQANINTWNGKSDLAVSDVDAEIDAYLDAIITALGNQVGG